MLGIICREEEKGIVEELFELVKMPWEYYKKGKPYDVVIADDDYDLAEKVKLLVIFNPNPCRFDKAHKINLSEIKTSKEICLNGEVFFILNKLSSLRGGGEPLLSTSNHDVVGIQIDIGRSVYIRVSYSLFEEALRLFTDGQPKEHALNPTLDIHIDILKDWIIKRGVPLVEIPPIPYGFDFITCLTHDIDFYYLRNHRADHTLLGLLYRTSIGAMMDWVQGRSTNGQLLRRWRFLLELPFIYTGVMKDPWVPIRDYPHIEKDLPATYFFIPFKKYTGTSKDGKKNYRRACPYEVGDLKEDLRQLNKKNHEMGVHGLDAWNNLEKAILEWQKISGLVQENNLGIRMHWLFFDQQTPGILEKAGYLYDSTSGYNDAVGYRNGTVQPFRFPGLHSLMELPLNVQDTAMLYKSRMGLREEGALHLVDRLIEKHKKFGGVLTLNWHDRSLAPERCWQDLYVKVLERLKKEKTLFCTGAQAVNWFKQRRAITFEGIAAPNPGDLLPAGNTAGSIGRPFLRIHNYDKKPYQDFPLN